MSFPSWSPQNFRERGRGERVDFDRASVLTVVSECLSLPFAFRGPLKFVWANLSFQFYILPLPIPHSFSVGV
jgi:hypothetical protein